MTEEELERRRALARSNPFALASEDAPSATLPWFAEDDQIAPLALGKGLRRTPYTDRALEEDWKSRDIPGNRDEAVKIASRGKAGLLAEREKDWADMANRGDVARPIEHDTWSDKAKSAVGGFIAAGRTPRSPLGYERGKVADWLVGGRGMDVGTGAVDFTGLTGAGDLAQGVVQGRPGLAAWGALDVGLNALPVLAGARALGRAGSMMEPRVSREALARSMTMPETRVTDISPKVNNRVQVAGEQNIIGRPQQAPSANAASFAEDLDDYFLPPPNAPKPLPKKEDMIGSVAPGTPILPDRPELFGVLPETGKPTPFRKDYPGFTPEEVKADLGQPLTHTIEGQRIPPGATVIGRQTVGGPNVGITTEEEALALARKITGRDVKFQPPENMPDRWGNYNIPNQQASVRADITGPERRTNLILHEGVGHPMDMTHRTGSGWFSKLMTEGKGVVPPKVTRQWWDNYMQRNYASEGSDKVVAQRKVRPAIQKNAPFVLPEGSPKNVAPEGYTGVSPLFRGYPAKGGSVGRENTAEALAAYAYQPEQFKKRNPELAAAIRAFFTSDPELAKKVIFNSIACAGAAGAGAAAFAPTEAEASRLRPFQKALRESLDAARLKAARETPPPPMGHNNPPPEGKFPQFKDAYPRYGDYTWEIKTPFTKDKAVKAELQRVPQEQRTEDKFYRSKVLSPEAKQLQKEREKIQAAINRGEYKPYFDVEKRYDVDPKNHPAPPVDTLKILPKTAVTQQKWRDDLVNNPEAMTRLREAYEAGKDLPNARNWYHVGQVEDEFVKEYGDVKGRTLFKDRFAAPMAATTGGADPSSNWLMAHFINYKNQQGEPLPTKESWLTPVGVGGRYGVGDWTHGPYGAQNPKRLNFMYDFLGHSNRATMDEQMTSGLMPGKNSPPAGTYGHFEEAVHKLADELKISPREVQEVAWAGFKRGKEGGGDEAYAGKPMVQTLNESIERTARLTGRTPEEVVRLGIVRGEIPMYSVGAAAAGGAAATGLLSEEQRSRVEELIGRRLEGGS